MSIITPEILVDWLNITLAMAKKSGSILKKYWGQSIKITEKIYPGDLVTEADKESEELIIKTIKTKFPSHHILAEESGDYPISGHSDFTWIIDPLDGTTNYTHQFPTVAISIGLFYQNEPILGVVYNPFYEEMFYATQGSGAFLNHKKIYVSKTSSLEKSLLATGFPYDRRVNVDSNYEEFCHLSHLTQGIRRLGAASLDLAYVAAGRLDGYWERGLKPWDMAAGIILVKEAGGDVSDYLLNPINLDKGKILASNGLLHQAISKELQNASKL